MAQVSYGTITITDTTDIERIYMVYAGSDSNTTPPNVNDFTLWKTDITQISGTYIWQRAVVKKSGIEITAQNFQQFYGEPVCITGEGGRSIKSITTYYCNYGTGTPDESYSGWKIDTPEYDEDKPNYWVKTVIIYVDDSETEFESSGSIVTIEDGEHKQVTSLSVDLQPIQDLHGYDHPWSGGNGKNKLDPDSITQGNYTSISTHNCVTDYLPIIANQAYTLSQTISTNGRYLRFYNSSKVEEDTNTRVSMYNKTESTFTTPNWASYVRIMWYKTEDEINPTYIIGLKPQLEEGSTATVWTPYSNICPISGRTECVTWDDPKYGGTVAWNQLQANTISRTQAGVDFTFADGVLTVNGTASANSWWLNLGQGAVNWEFFKNHVYLISVGNKDYNNHVGNDYYWYFPDAINPSTLANNNTIRKAVNNSRTYMQFIVRKGQTANNVKFKPQLFDLTQMFGSTIADYIYSLEQANAGAGVAWFKKLFPKDFYAYNSGETTCVSAVNGDPYKHYTTDLGRTVYGGTLDVVSGVLTVDRVLYTYTGNEAVADRSGSYIPVELGNAGIYQTAPAPCTDFAEVLVNGNGWSYVNTTMTKDELKTYLTNNTVSIVAYLATPQTYQLTPTEVELLKGDNNVWSDSGEIEVSGFTIVDRDIQIHLDNGLTNALAKSADAQSKAINALEKANNASQAVALMGGHFIYKSSSSGNSTPAGAGVIRNLDDNPANWGYNTWIGSNGIVLRHGENILSKWMTTGISFYNTNHIVTSTFGDSIALASNGASITIGSTDVGKYNTYIDTQGLYLRTGTTSYATLNSNGLVLSKGGIKVIPTNGKIGDNNSVYISSENLGSKVTSLDADKTNWRAVIGSKFAVDSEGNLYANNANISGTINATHGSIAEDVSIGGLASYSTTVQMNSAINQKVDELTTTIAEVYATQEMVDEKADVISVYTKSEIDQTVSDINLSVQVVEESLNTGLTEAQASIDLKIDRAADTGDLLSNINAIADQITLLASQINFGNNSTVASELSTLNSAVSINTTPGNESIRIGTSNDFYIMLTPTELGFYQNENKVAYVSNNQLYITQSVVVQQMDVGIQQTAIDPTTGDYGLGQWSWKVHDIDEKNNLYLKWLG